MILRTGSIVPAVRLTLTSLDRAHQRNMTVRAALNQWAGWSGGKRGRGERTLKKGQWKAKDNRITERMERKGRLSRGENDKENRMRRRE